MHSEGGFFPNQNNRKSEAPRDHNKNQDTVTPICISWLLDSAQNVDDDVIKIDGHVMYKMSICGRIVDHSTTATKSFVKIDDGTDVIDLVCNKKYDELMPKVLEGIDLTSSSSYWWTFRLWKRDRPDVRVSRSMLYFELTCW